MDKYGVCPLEWRYGSEELRRILSYENIIKKMIEVEVALLIGLANAGIIPKDIVSHVEKCVDKVSVERVIQLEKELGHEVMALTVALGEVLGEASKYVHLGATSNDIIDTAWILVLRESLLCIKSKLRNIIERLIDLAKRYRDCIMIGRTHGQHALPITLGFKFANYVYELSRSYERICDLEKRLIRGKISGAVGTMAAWGDKGLDVEKYALQTLNLEPHIISTQVAPRDGFAELISVIAILGSQLDRLAIEVRELMRPEIMEIAEGVSRKVGSSTMPHKQNPITCEKISGLAKILRSLVIASLENIPLWHERDLTNSSSERILIPHTLLILDEILNSTLLVLENLVIYPENMKKNLTLLKGINMAESILVRLVRKGVPRLVAYDHLKHLINYARSTGKEFEDVLINDEFVRKYLSINEIKEAMRPENYLGSIDKLIDRAINYAYKIMKYC